MKIKLENCTVVVELSNDNGDYRILFEKDDKAVIVSLDYTDGGKLFNAIDVLVIAVKNDK